MRTRLLFILITILTALMLIAGAAFFLVVSDLPHIPDDLRNLVYSQPSEIYAGDGSLVQRLGGRSYVPLSQINPHFQQAILAAEDGEFYSHHGIDKVAITRAAVFTLIGRGLQSGSTITQQLAKNLFFSFRPLPLRKFKEILISLQLESTFTKEQILEAYCNLVYFGGSAYGVEDAAQQFFGKPAAALNLSEAAMLAGIVNSPYYFNPFSHFEAAQSRQRLILRRMLNKGFIDAPTYELVTADSVRLTSRPSFGNDFIDYVIPEAEKRFGREAVHYGGLKIYTTLDPQLQAIAEQALAEGVTKLEADLDSTGAPLQGALAAVSVPTGEVRALIGARRYVPGGFNRATNSNRHVGSGIKPFVYITALENLHSDGRSLTPISVVYDTMVTFPIPNQPRWRPRNFDRRHRGQLILKSALMQSINTISAQLTDQLTPRKVIETCRRLGVSSPIDEVLPLSLGTAGISPLEMASAYAVFANNGMYYRPIVIKRVEDVNGTVLDRAFVFGDPRVDPKLTYEMLDMMRGVIDGGTAKVIRASGFDAPAAGKTGTSTEFTDAWFTGFTTSLATSIWVGYDRVYQMYIRRRGVDGARGAAPIWAEFMKRATKLYPVREFEIPSGIKIWQVDPRTGQLVPDPQYGIPVALPEGIEPETPSSWERPPFVPESDTTEAG